MAESLPFSDYLLSDKPDEPEWQASRLLWGYFRTPVTMAIVCTTGMTTTSAGSPPTARGRSPLAAGWW